MTTETERTALVERVRNAEALALGLSVHAADGRTRALTEREASELAIVLGDAGLALSSAPSASPCCYEQWFGELLTATIPFVDKAAALTARRDGVNDGATSIMRVELGDLRKLLKATGPRAVPRHAHAAPSASQEEPSQGQERTALIAEARVCAEELDDAAGSCYDGAQSCSGTGEKQEEARCMRRYHRLAKAENIISRLADALEALSSSAPADPIAAAVDAQLDPLKDELIAMGHRLAKDMEKSNAECEHYWVYDFAVEAHTCVRCGKRIDNAAAARLINAKAGAPR
jgi:hypothetical protein